MIFSMFFHSTSSPRHNNQRRKAVIVGAGTNGLTAAIVLARAGWEVDVFERSPSPGGAATSGEVFGAGSIVDCGAAAHPFGVASPIFQELELEKYGLQWAHSSFPLAHPLDDAPAALLYPSLQATAEGLSRDGTAWRRLHGHIVEHIDEHLENFLGPIVRWPAHPLRMARFGLAGMASASALGKAFFRGEHARALLAGSAVHAIVPPSQPLTGAFGMLFSALGMSRGWPVAIGGTQSITNALVGAASAHGVSIRCNAEVKNVAHLPDHDAVLFNLTPQQILQLRGVELNARSAKRFTKWRYGTGVFKVDYLLSEAVPWADPRVGEATTVHVGGTALEIDQAEKQARAGKLPQKPFVLVCQQQVADPSRASSGHVLWTYAHVPHGYKEKQPGEVASLIEAQIERFAPGFKDTIRARHSTSPQQLEAWNPNIIGGDIAGGTMAGLRVLFRPGATSNPYRIGPHAFMASGATPPGAGVHGMAGAHAAYSILNL